MKKIRFNKNRPVVVNKESSWTIFKKDFKTSVGSFGRVFPIVGKFAYNASAGLVNVSASGFNWLFNVKTFFLTLAIALASVDVILAASSFTATYRSLGDYALYIVIIFVLAEFGAMKLLLTPLPHRGQHRPVKPRTVKQEKLDKYERTLSRWKISEKGRKLTHWVKFWVIKFSAMFLLIGLAVFFINFSYAKLSEATTQDVVASEQYDSKLAAIQEQRQSLERSIEKQYEAIDNLPVNFRTQRADRLRDISELEDQLRELARQEMTVRTADSVADIVSLQIRYTVEALAETRFFSGLTVKEYIGTVNVLLAIGLVSSYLLFFLVSQILTTDKQILRMKKVRYKK